MVDNGGRLDEACVGDLVVLEAKAAGLAGLVIWGLHRDSADIRAIGLPVFSLGTTPVGPQRLGARRPDALAETIRDTERRQAQQIRGGISLRMQLRFDAYLAQRQQRPSLTFRDHLRAVGGAIEE